MSFFSKAFKKVSHVANGVVHTVDSVAHNHIFQAIAGATAIVFPVVGIPLAAGAAAEHVGASVLHHVDVSKQLGHVVDAADHVLNAVNSKVHADVVEAGKLIDHTKQLAAQGHAGAANALVVLYRRSAARKAAANFHVDPHTARVLDKRSGQPANISPHIHLPTHV